MNKIKDNLKGLFEAQAKSNKAKVGVLNITNDFNIDYFSKVLGISKEDAKREIKNFISDAKTDFIKCKKSLDMVVVHCYYNDELWYGRKNAFDFYMDCLGCSDGCEQNRYANIIYDLNAGLNFASDGVE